jgi:hypothetical protein
VEGKVNMKILQQEAEKRAGVIKLFLKSGRRRGT